MAQKQKIDADHGDPEKKFKGSGSADKASESGVIQRRMHEFADRPLLREDKQEFGRLLARAFAKGNIAYADINDPKVRELFEWPRPSISLPTRLTLGRIVKKNARDAVASDLKQLEDRKFLTLTFDGFTAISKRCVMGRFTGN